MGRAELYSRHMQRMVTNGDVIYVHVPTPAAATQPPQPDPEPETPESPVLEEAEQPAPTGEGNWLYTQAPEGYAVEFGTGRLVRVRQPQIIQGSNASETE